MAGRWYLLGSLITIAGCSATPADFGITGPRDAPGAPVQVVQPIDNIPAFDPNSRPDPMMNPIGTGGRYWGYNTE